MSTPFEGKSPSRPGGLYPVRVALAPGRRIGPYEVAGELGRGNMGVVARARHVELAREVALKVLFEPDAESAGARRFDVEMEALARLDHPGIVRIHEAGVESDGTRWFAMQLVPGQTLERVLARREGAPSLDDRLRLVAEVTRALAYAHAHGIVHRDVKAQNVLVGEDGLARLADFGVALDLERRTRLSRTGQMLGTPAAMSPEQVRGEKDVGAATDIWAAGVLLYRAATGEPPFSGASPAELFYAIEHRDPAPPSAVAPAVPRALDRVCARALAKRPRDRYPTAGDLAADIERVRRGEAPAAPSRGVASRAGDALLESGVARAIRAMPAFGWIALALGIASISVGALAVGGGSAERRPVRPARDGTPSQGALGLPMDGGSDVAEGAAVRDDHAARARSLVEEARRHLARGDFEAARDDLDLALALAPQDPQAALLRCRAGAALLRTDEACRDWALAFAGRPRDFSVLAEHAALLAADPDAAGSVDPQAVAGARAAVVREDAGRLARETEERIRERLADHLRLGREQAALAFAHPALATEERIARIERHARVALDLEGESVKARLLLRDAAALRGEHLQAALAAVNAGRRADADVEDRLAAAEGALVLAADAERRGEIPRVREHAQIVVDHFAQASLEATASWQALVLLSRALHILGDERGALDAAFTARRYLEGDRERLLAATAWNAPPRDGDDDALLARSLAGWPRGALAIVAADRAIAAALAGFRRSEESERVLARAAEEEAEAQLDVSERLAHIRESLRARPEEARVALAELAWSLPGDPRPWESLCRLARDQMGSGRLGTIAPWALAGGRGWLESPGLLPEAVSAVDGLAEMGILSDLRDPAQADRQLGRSLEARAVRGLGMLRLAVQEEDAASRSTLLAAARDEVDAVLAARPDALAGHMLRAGTLALEGHPGELDRAVDLALEAASGAEGPLASAADGNWNVALAAATILVWSGNDERAASLLARLAAREPAPADMAERIASWAPFEAALRRRPLSELLREMRGSGEPR